jgi:hypothetical protein
MYMGALCENKTVEDGNDGLARSTNMNETTPGIRFLDIDDEAAGILAYAVDGGEITEEDVAPVWARFEDAKANDKKIRIYAEMSAIPSTSGGVIVEKLKHLGSIMSTLERMAIVGDAGWMGIYAKLVNPVTKPDIRHFTTEQRDAAVAWIQE